MSNPQPRDARVLCGVLCRVQAHDESGHEGTIAERVSEAFTHSAECCISAVYERSLEDLVEEAGEHLAKCAEQGSTTGQVTPAPPPPPHRFAASGSVPRGTRRLNRPKALLDSTPLFLYSSGEAFGVVIASTSIMLGCALAAAMLVGCR